MPVFFYHEAKAANSLSPTAIKPGRRKTVARCRSLGSGRGRSAASSQTTGSHAWSFSWLRGELGGFIKKT